MVSGSEMKHARIILVILIMIVLISITPRNVIGHAQSQQYYGAGGGEISGYVFDANKHPVDWAPVIAKNAEHSFEAFSGMSGFYLMRVPAGTYNVTINAPGYEGLVANTTVAEGSVTNMNFHLNSINIAVSAGSSSVINFYLQQTQTPVPEFQPNMSLTLIVLIMAAVLLLRRSAKR